MKHIALILAVATAMFVQASKPIMVGHRGSLYGVENTVESFRNGADLGYEYLETDFRVTADSVLVCSHDEHLKRLSGDSIVVAEATLAELQGLPLRQTRGGVEYTGRLASAQEYLDVCREKGVRPLIELKWSTGINSKDCSNIPMLIDFIEKNGFRDKCIILTSMKPCLEYIRKHYPDVTLQFLTGQYWPNHFDWCLEHRMDVDIQRTYFTAEDVRKFHDAGLKVNVWTVNTPEDIATYTEAGCDFLTTDKYRE